MTNRVYTMHDVQVVLTKHKARLWVDFIGHLLETLARILHRQDIHWVLCKTIMQNNI